MESTGQPSRIQLSPDTANLLKEYGKEDWFVAREDKVTAKGKGEMQTYWLTISSKESDNAETKSCTSESLDADTVHSRDSRGTLVSHRSITSDHDRRNRASEWTVEVLAHALKGIVARRKARCIKSSSPKLLQQLEQASIAHDGAKIVIDEVSTYVPLPSYDDGDMGLDPSQVLLEAAVMEELREYVRTIAQLYNQENPFHNFDRKCEASNECCRSLFW
jgi:hypothetical protein